MKHRVKKLSSHQNGKVFGIIMGLLTIPFMLAGISMMLLMPMLNQHGEPLNIPFGLLVFAPLIYGIFGYFVAFIGCALYNITTKLHGGFEFETTDA